MADSVIRKKLVVLGDYGVGKTSFFTRFIYDSFKDAYSDTVGIDFVTKAVQVTGGNVKALMFDSPPCRRFRSIISHSSSWESHLNYLIYDITNRCSFESIPQWQAYTKPPTKSFLIGTKSDLAVHRQVAFEQGHQLAKQLNACFMEVSSKTGVNVEQAIRLGVAYIM